MDAPWRGGRRRPPRASGGGGMRDSDGVQGDGLRGLCLAIVFIRSIMRHGSGPARHPRKLRRTRPRRGQARAARSTNLRHATPVSLGPARRSRTAAPTTGATASPTAIRAATKPADGGSALAGRSHRPNHATSHDGLRRADAERPRACASHLPQWRRASPRSATSGSADRRDDAVRFISRVDQGDARRCATSAQAPFRRSRNAA